MAREGEAVMALDVGTSKVCAVAGRLQRGAVQVIGFGIQTSQGLRKGQVVDMDAMASCVQAAAEEAEHVAGREIPNVVLGVCSTYVRSRLAQGAVPLPSGEVTAADVQRAVERAAQPGPGPGEVQLHALPMDFVVDGQTGVREPVGMAGRRLEVDVHVVEASAAPVMNLVTACQRAGLNVRSVVLELLASGGNVLEDDERAEGAVLIDVGGGTTDVGIWWNGRLVHASVLGVGGDHVTRSVAVGLKVGVETAARLKERSGCALTERVDKSELIVLPSSREGRPQHGSRKFLAAIIEPALEEIFTKVAREIARSGCRSVVRRAVLTGGTSSMPGVVELAERTLGVPVRAGVPGRITGLVEVVRQPRYGAAVGLLHHALCCEDPNAFFRIGRDTPVRRFSKGMQALVRRLF